MNTLRTMASDRLTPILLDVTQAASIKSAAQEVSSVVQETGLGGLVNNAGIVIAGPLEFLPLDEIRKQLEVNVIGYLAVSQAFLPFLRQGQGRIINIGSTGGRVALPFLGPYNASKFALEAFSDCLRNELRPWNITVSIVEPNFIATAIWKKSQDRADKLIQSFTPEAKQLYGEQIAVVRRFYPKLGQMATPADAVAETIFKALTSVKPKSRYVVGRGAWLATAVFARLPDRLRDFVISQLLLS
jgi:NAD(P)-dependent dehydrogenase (short-subunit alcohol dehydrogenase family)